jgi:hypothetical protein
VSPEPDEPEAAPEPPKRPRVPALVRGLIILLLVAGILAAVGYFVVGPDEIRSIIAEVQQPRPAPPAEDGEPGAQAEPPKGGITPEVRAARADALARAQESLAAATDIPVGDPALQARVAESLEDADAHQRAARIYGVIWREDSSNQKAALDYARTLLAAGSFRRARGVAIEGMQLADAVDDGPFREIFDETLERDPKLVDVETVTLEPDEQLDAIYALGGGKSASFRFTKGGESLYAFKPHQKEWEDGWRVEVASWRLCEMVVCHFEIPHNRPARISREDFEALYDRVSPKEHARQDDYRARFDDLIWKTEAGPDGVEREYLYGTLKDWVPDITNWPIEYTSVWRDWLSVSSDMSSLQAPLEDALSDLQPYRDGKYYREILARRGDITTLEMARQLSSILVFDYLTNNWDRFSGNEEWYGVNNHFALGRFVSLDNGAAFQPRASTRVKGRFGWTTRFSRDTITSVRALSPELVDPILFPDPSPVEKVRLEVFWDQRKRLLERVDALMADWGSERVYTFE